MLDFMWGIMIAIGVVYGAATGNLEAVTQAVLDSAGEAVSICITMVGVMSLWVGLMEIASEAGLITKMTQAIHPAMHFMFPRIPGRHPALEYISTNVIANILGLGWAATPAGLKAMESLAELEEERLRTGDIRASHHTLASASDEMCTFLVLNISSLQLIPVSIIAYRSQYGSPNPPAVIAPAILATLASTLAAILFCKCMTAGRKG